MSQHHCRGVNNHAEAQTNTTRGINKHNQECNQTQAALNQVRFSRKQTQAHKLSTRSVFRANKHKHKCKQTQPEKMTQSISSLLNAHPVNRIDNLKSIANALCIQSTGTRAQIQLAIEQSLHNHPEHEHFHKEIDEWGAFICEKVKFWPFSLSICLMRYGPSLF